MLFFSNEKYKIILYFFNITNINSHSFKEQSNSCFIEKEFVCIEPECVNTNSQINLTPSAHVIYPPQPTEIGTDECIALDLTTRSKEPIIHNADQQDLIFSSSGTEEDSFLYNIYDSNELEETPSNERSREIHVEAINTNIGKKHSNEVISDSKNNQTVKNALDDTGKYKYFKGGIFRPYLPEKVDISRNRGQYNHHTYHYDHDTTRCDVLPSFSREKLATPMPFDCFKTDELHYGIKENVVLSRPLDYEWNSQSDTKTPQYFSTTPLLGRNINPNNIAFEDTNQLLDEIEIISDITSLPTNKITNHLKRSSLCLSYKSIGSRDFFDEPPKKFSRHISTVVDDNNSLISYTPQNIEKRDKDIMDDRNQLESNYTFFSTDKAEVDSIGCASTDTNTQQQTCKDTDLELSDPEQVIPEKFFKISMKDYEKTENDEASLKRISEDHFNFNFILKDTSISWSFDRKDRANLFLEISSTSIKATDANFAESVFNISIKNFSSKHYVFSIPIFHTLEFISLNNISYFRISVVTSKYGINQTIDINIYRSRKHGRQELLLKCPRIHDFKQLINKILETTFPIYAFPVTENEKIITFHSLSHVGTIKKKMTLNEYIEGEIRKPLIVKTPIMQEYNFGPALHTVKMKTPTKTRVCWETGLQIAYDIFKTFHTNITQILTIIDENSKTLICKKGEINKLLDEIIQEIKKVYCILYPRQIKEDNERDWELMSFYVFCVNEVQCVLEWWNKYIFVINEVQYISNHV